MSLFGGFLSAIGLGGNNVQQNATNKTAVTVNDTIQNQIDLTPIANAIKSTAAGTTSILQQLVTGQQLSLAVGAAAVQATQQQAAAESSLATYLKLAGFGLAAYIAWRFL